MLLYWDTLHRSVYYAATDGFMIEVCWAPMFAAFSVPLNQSDDEVVIALCLEGFHCAIHVTAAVSMKTHRDAFVTSLTRFTSLHSPADIKQKNIDAIKILETAFKKETVGLVSREEYAEKRVNIRTKIEEKEKEKLRRLQQEEEELQLQKLKKRKIKVDPRLSFSDDFENDNEEDKDENTEYLQKVDPKSEGGKRDSVAIYDVCTTVSGMTPQQVLHTTGQSFTSPGSTITSLSSSEAVAKIPSLGVLCSYSAHALNEAFDINQLIVRSRSVSSYTFNNKFYNIRTLSSYARN